MKNIFKNALTSAHLKTVIILLIITAALLKCVIFCLYNLLSAPPPQLNTAHLSRTAKQSWNQTTTTTTKTLSLTRNHHRILTVDQKLRAMAMEYIEQPFVHPLVPKQQREDRKNHTPSGPKMNSVREIATVTWPPFADIRRPCGGNEGQGLLAAVLVFCVVGDFSRRKAIRETFGSALKAHPQTELYFVVARVDNAS